MENEELIKELLLTEEDKKADIAELVKMLKPLVKIDETSGKIILLEKDSHSNYEKILLLLVGKFLAQKIGLVSSASLSIGEISTDLDILKTTLSAPLGVLVSKKKIKKENKKDGQSKYAINEMNITSALKEISSRGVKDENQ